MLLASRNLLATHEGAYSIQNTFTRDIDRCVAGPLAAGDYRLNSSMITPVIVLQNAAESAKGRTAVAQLTPYSEWRYLFGVSQSQNLLSVFTFDHHHLLLACQDHTASQ